MATKNFRSTVLEPTSEFAYGDKLRFTALATVGEVLKGSFSEATIGEDGVYSIDLQYGKHRIDYKPYEGVWRHFADVEVNADTLATTLQDLALASVPVTDDAVLVLQGILADAEAAKTAAESAETAAETALASIDETIDEAKSGYPDVVKAMFNVTMYVDNVSGDDANSGATAALAKKTLKSAIESTPSSCYLSIVTKNTGSDYLIDSDISAMSRFVSISLAGATIRQAQDLSSDTYKSYKIKMSDGSYIGVLGGRVATAKFTQEKAGTFEDYNNAMFYPENAFNAKINLTSCEIDINNSPLAHVHAGGSISGAIDLFVGTSRITPLATLAVATSSRKLIGSYGAISYPLKLIVNSLTNETGLAWSDLIPSNSMLQTNIIMTISRGGSEYINLDASTENEVDISVDDFEAILSEQQAQGLFESEKNIALKIMADFNLGTGEHEITGSDISDVRAYIQSIDPAKGLKAGHLQRAKIPRPSIFDRYKKNPYEL